MDTLNQYRDIVERTLEAFTRIPHPHGAVQCVPIFDRTRDRYLLMDVGWEKHKRIHHPVIHIDIIDGKLWIQTDNTDAAIASELVQAGVPKDHIVLAFRPPEVRKHTEYAVV